MKLRRSDVGARVGFLLCGRSIKLPKLHFLSRSNAIIRRTYNVTAIWSRISHNGGADSARRLRSFLDYTNALFSVKDTL